jgi:hypothetical protein
VSSLKDWAEFLTKSADVQFSIGTSNDAMVCDLIYVGDETPRLFATKLKIATGEDFRHMRTDEVRTDTSVDAAKPDLASAEATGVERSAQVSLMITRAQRRDLRNLGYSDADIRAMTPAEAQRNLGLTDKSATCKSAT